MTVLAAGGHWRLQCDQKASRSREERLQSQLFSIQSLPTCPKVNRHETRHRCNLFFTFLTGQRCGEYDSVTIAPDVKEHANAAVVRFLGGVVDPADSPVGSVTVPGCESTGTFCASPSATVAVQHRVQSSRSATLPRAASPQLLRIGKNREGPRLGALASTVSILSYRALLRTIKDTLRTQPFVQCFYV